MDILQLNAPAGWKVSTVGESYIICNQLREPINATVRESMKGEYPYYGPTQVVDYLDHYRLDGKYALIGEDGDHFLKYATRPMTQLATGKFNVNNHAHVIQNTEECSVEWFYYFFMHTSIFPFLTRQGAGRYKLNKAALEQIPILIPPLPEQRKIAEILSTWDEAIDLTEQLIAAKQRRKQALMQRLLTGQVRFPGFVESTARKFIPGLGDLPFDWEVVQQGKVARFFNGRAYKKSEWEEAGTPVIRLQNLTGRGSEFYYSTLKLPEHQYCNKGDLLYMWSATFGPHIWQGDKAIFHYHIWKVECSEKLHQKFLYFMLAHLTDSWMSNTNGMGLLHITKETMESLQIPLPSVAEQCKIADVLSKCDEELDLHQQKLTALRRQKQGLMQQLLTGRLRVKV